MSASQLSRLALENQRRVYNQRQEAQATAQAAQQDFGCFYAGYEGGQHWGRLPGGGMIPVEPQSNGALEIGAPFIASIGSGSTIAKGRWMP